MAEYSGRRVADGLGLPKKGSRLISRDCTKIRDQDIQLCNHIGCSGRLNSARSTRNVNLDKTKVLKPLPSRYSGPSKEITAIPSKVVMKVNNPVKPLRGIQKNSPSETASPSSRGDAGSDVQEAEVATSDPSLLTLLQSDESTSMEIGSPSVGTNLRPKRNFLKKPASVDGSNLTGSRGSGGSKSTPQLSRPNVLTTRPVSRYLRCSSVPVVATSDSASSRKLLLKKRSSEGESSSSSRAKQPMIAESRRTSNSLSGISISVTRQAQRAQTSFMDNVSALVRARRLDTSTSRRQPLMSQRASSTDQRMHRLPYSHSTTGRPHRAHNLTCPKMTESSHGLNFTGTSDVAHSSSLIDQEDFRRYNINEIAEVLMALDHIERVEEISYEQLIALESNLFLNGLSFHDQHRDMRLDIDGMSYEELLALEERMGSVSTALSEEALAKSINKSAYKPISSFSDTGRSEDDTKCSICQEEYDVGDEMGRLHCKHSFHVECIDQWFRQKNWCPICKSSAASSPS